MTPAATLVCPVANRAHRQRRDGALHAEFSAPSAGPPPWYVYEATPTTTYAFGTAEPYGATRFRFAPG